MNKQKSYRIGAILYFIAAGLSLVTFLIGREPVYLSLCGAFLAIGAMDLNLFHQAGKEEDAEKPATSTRTMKILSVVAIVLTAVAVVMCGAIFVTDIMG